jgi:hypothetical protein
LEIIQPQSQPSLRESVFLQEEYNLDELSIDIVKVSEPNQRVTPIRELLPRGPQAKEDVLLVKFCVQESGFYQINVFYQGYNNNIHKLQLTNLKQTITCPEAHSPRLLTQLNWILRQRPVYERVQSF